MFTAYIYVGFLASPDEFWRPFHYVLLWSTGLLLDAMLLAWLAFTVAALTGGAGRAAAVHERARRLLARADIAVAAVAGTALCILVSITFFSVIGRKFYKPIPDDITFAEWAMVGLIALMLAGVQGRGEHIEVNALSGRLGAQANRLLRFAGLLIGLAVVSRLTFVNIEQLPRSFLETTYGSIYEMPLWPPRFLFLLGLAWWSFRIAMQCSLMAFRTFVPGLASDRDGDLTPLLPAESGMEGDLVDELGQGERHGS